MATARLFGIKKAIGCRHFLDRRIPRPTGFSADILTEDCHRHHLTDNPFQTTRNNLPLSTRNFNGQCFYHNFICFKFISVHLFFNGCKRFWKWPGIFLIIISFLFNLFVFICFLTVARSLAILIVQNLFAFNCLFLVATLLYNMWNCSLKCN